MYTRCSECETLFRVTREQLNAARGQVRCGHCGKVFDALANLREEIAIDPPTTFPSAPQAEMSSPIDEEVIDAPGAISDDELFKLLAPQPARRPRWPWVVAAVVLVLVIALQVIHFKRYTLIDNPLFGPFISKAYDSIGQPLRTSSVYNLSAFSLLHHELVTHPRTGGTLHLSGVLSNDADHAQPWPILELRLEDRFGDVVAARRLEAKEYLRNPPENGELMPAGARRAIEIAFADPGEDAVGFSIDFCVMLDDGLRCAGQGSF